MAIIGICQQIYKPARRSLMVMGHCAVRVRLVKKHQGPSQESGHEDKLVFIQVATAKNKFKGVQSCYTLTAGHRYETQRRRWLGFSTEYLVRLKYMYPSWLWSDSISDVDFISLYSK